MYPVEVDQFYFSTIICHCAIFDIVTILFVHMHNEFIYLLLETWHTKEWKSLLNQMSIISESV